MKNVKNKSGLLALIAMISVILLTLGTLFAVGAFKPNYNKPINNEIGSTYECSFTKTYLVNNLWTIDIKEEIPGMSPVILKQFQSDDVIYSIIPSELRDKLQEDKYYEFTYTIRGKDISIENMNDINAYFIKNGGYDNSKITIDAIETDKQGLEQIQDGICSLK